MLDAGMKIGVTDAYLYGPEVEALQDDPAYAGQFIIAEVGETNATRLLDLVIDAYLEDVIVGTSIVRRRGLAVAMARFDRYFDDFPGWSPRQCVPILA